MVRESPLHETRHGQDVFLGWWSTDWWWFDTRGQFFSIVRVKAPTSTSRRAVPINEQAQSTALFSVEIRHAKRLSRLREIGEAFSITKKHRTRFNREINLLLSRPVQQSTLHESIFDLENAEPCRIGSANDRSQLLLV